MKRFLTLLFLFPLLLIAGAQAPMQYAPFMVQPATSTLGVGLVGYWKFDESSGAAADSSGNGNSGTLNGSSPAYVSGKFGNAIALDAAGSDYVSMGNPAVLQVTTGTISCWMYYTGSVATSYSMLVSKMDLNNDQNGFCLYRSATAMTWELANGSTFQAVGILGTLPTNSVWHHMVLTWDGSNVKIYKDAVQHSSTSQTVTPVTTVHNFTVGRDAVYTGSYYSGMIDDVRIWSRALTTNEVTELYLLVP